MNPLTVAAVLSLSAALIHAVWNVLLKTSNDPLQVSARAFTAMALPVALLAAGGWWLQGRPAIPAAVWLLAAISGVLEVIYLNLLSLAYSRGEVSTVYPLARGTAPLLAVLAGIFILRQQLTVLEGAAALLLLLGIWAVHKPAPAGRATIPALLTGVAIAAYTSIDAVGARHTAPWIYLALVWVMTALLLSGWVPLRHRMWERDATEAAGIETSWARAVLIGSMMTVGYGLVLVALSIAPLAVVAPLRESAVVLVAGWGVWRLRERDGIWLRLAGAAGIVAGVGLLALS